MPDDNQSASRGMDISRAPHSMPALDGIRGLAILLVLAIHFSIIVDAKSAMEIILRRATSLGWIGVDLFFVLSGFLITGILTDTKGSPHYFRNFYARRVLRIFPLYYGTLIVTLLFLPMFPAYHTSDSQLMLDNQVWAWTYAINIFETVNPSHSFFVLTHFWSLAVEEHFYLVWPVLVWGLSRKGMARVCLLTIVAAPLFRLFWVLQMGSGEGAFLLTPSRMDSLAWGGLIAVLRRSAWNDERLIRAGSWAGSVSLAALVFMWSRRFDLDRFGDPAFEVVGYSLLAVAFASAVLSMSLGRRHGFFRRGFEHKAMRFFGKYSYGLYVVHWPILILMTQALHIPDRLALVVPTRTASMAVFYLLALGSSVAAAYVSYHLVEKRFLDLKKYFEPTLGVDPSGALPSASTAVS